MNMILPRREDAVHKAVLYRLLMGILDTSELAHAVHFKGGTCAAMLGYLNRFSVDLDFDLDANADKSQTGMILERVISKHAFTIKEKSKTELFYILKYKAPTARSSLKISIVDSTYQNNVYVPHYLSEIDRYASCQTIETMFAHKLVSLTDRYAKYRTIAGRDVYDIHSFFSQGLSYNKALIVERCQKDIYEVMSDLVNFIQTHITEKVITQDLSYLLPHKEFAALRHTLKQETLVYLSDEILRIKTNHHS